MNSWIEKAIQSQKYKLTPSRKVIFSYLESLEGLFCAQDILEHHPQLDKVSVYRTIQLLEKLDIIRKSVVIRDSQMYELHDHDNHHHHAVCESCNSQACVPCDMPESTPNIPGFAKVHHDVQFRGVCINCV